MSKGKGGGGRGLNREPRTIDAMKEIATNFNHEADLVEEGKPLFDMDRSHVAAIRNYVKGKYNIIAPLQDAGYEAYFVGGPVRDMLLGNDPKDFDVATTAPPDEIKRILNVTKTYGKINEQFLVVSFKDADGDMFDVAQLRDDSAVRGGRYEGRPKAGTMKTDVKRRDFTINAMYYNPFSGKLIDPAGGARDLKNKILRTTDKPDKIFKDDPTRIMRAVRFAAQLGLKPAFDLAKYIPAVDMSVGRNQQEFDKIKKKGLLGKIQPDILSAIQRKIQ